MKNVFTVKRFTVRKLARGAMIAAVYAALTLALAPISYGQFQLRVSEALCVLPLFLPEAVPGLFIGCLIANIGSSLGVADIVFGSLLSLAAALCTWLLRKQPAWIALLPPVIFNAFGVGALLYYLADLPFWVSSLWVGIGQAAAVYIIGLPLSVLIKKRFAGSKFFQ